MGFIFTILVFGGVGLWLKYVYFSPDAVRLRGLLVGKNEEEAKVIKYFNAKGWFAKKISDDEYLEMVYHKRDSMNIKQMAIDSLGIDEEDVKEIPPVMLEGFVYKDAYVHFTANDYVSSTYQVAWLFFSSTQFYIYRFTFNMDNSKKESETKEFFYKDVTSLSTKSDPEKTINLYEPLESKKFSIIVPGDGISVSMTGVSNADGVIQAMKQKVREKKQ